MQLYKLLKLDSVKLIGRSVDRFNELKHKQWDWKSFYNGWIEGRTDICNEEIKESYTKQDLSDAWHHGAIRSPKEFMHLNNFDEYFNHKHKS